MKRTHADILLRNRPLSTLLGLLCGCLVAANALALPEDRDQPMNITADEGTFKSGSGEAHFRGNVYLKQGTLELWADTLDVIRDPETGDIKFLEAHGQPARYQEQMDADSGLIKMHGLRIEYKPEEEVVISEGEAHLEQEGNETDAHYILYNVTDETLQVRSRRANGEDPDAPQATWVLQPQTVEELDEAEE